MEFGDKFNKDFRRFIVWSILAFIGSIAIGAGIVWCIKLLF